MVLLPINMNTTKFKLDQITIERRRGTSIGMSAAGDPCRRKVWMEWRWAAETQPISGRMNRIFKQGDHGEELIISDLERIGIKVTDQQQEMWGLAGHVHGFTDGRCFGVPEAPKTEHLLECKTAKHSEFLKVKKHGVLKNYPKHYYQCQSYMGRLKLTRALYVIMDKDTAELYVERIKFDSSYHQDQLRKERDIIISEVAPTKEYKADFFGCKFCPIKGICHSGDKIQKSCRSCEHVDLADKGIWVCSLTHKHLSKQEQIKGCGEYSLDRKAFV